MEQIDVLLLLYARSDRAWSAAEVSQELTSSEGSIGRRLAVLYRRRLATRDSAYRYRYLPSESTDALVEELRDQYAVRPAKVIDLIYSARTSALESFSDAFLFGGESEDADG